MAITGTTLRVAGNVSASNTVGNSKQHETAFSPGIVLGPDG